MLTQKPDTQQIIKKKVILKKISFVIIYMEDLTIM